MCFGSEKDFEKAVIENLLVKEVPGVTRVVGV